MKHGDRFIIYQMKVIDFAGYASWTNPDNPVDIDDDESLNARDALLLVYEIRTRGPRTLPRPTPGFRPPPWLDANADGDFNALDVFLDGVPAETAARDYCDVLRIRDAIYRSAETGQRVAL